MIKILKTGIKSYALSQLTVGIQLGVAISYCVLSLKWSYMTAAAVILPLGLPLVLLQSVIGGYLMSKNQNASATPPRPRTIIGGESYGWDGFSAMLLAGFKLFIYGLLSSLGVGVAIITVVLLSNQDLDGLVNGAGLPPWMLAISSLLQFLVMVAVALAIIVAYGWMKERKRPEWLKIRIKDGLGLRDASKKLIVIALIGGLTVGWFPAWLAQIIIDKFPNFSLGAVSSINDALLTDNIAISIAMAGIIAILGPIAEELVFRGFIWDVLRRALPAPAVLIITSLLFAASHLDPSQAIPLLFTAFFFGWLRLISGSILLPTVAHIANNSIGVIDALSGQVLQPTTPIVMLTAVACCMVAFWSWKTANTNLSYADQQQGEGRRT